MASGAVIVGVAGDMVDPNDITWDCTKAGGNVCAISSALCCAVLERGCDVLLVAQDSLLALQASCSSALVP
jgi:hypothetical protein